MKFVYRVEKTVFIMILLAILTATALTATGALAGVTIAVLMNLPILETLKIGALIGMLSGTSIGMLLSLAYMFNAVEEDKKR